MLTQLQTAFSHRGRVIAGVFILPVDAAIEYVAACQERGYEIAGVEGFKIMGGKIQPQQEDSNDYYGATGRHGDCIAFLSQRAGRDLWFEVVVEERR